MSATGLAETTRNLPWSHLQAADVLMAMVAQRDHARLEQLMRA